MSLPRRRSTRTLDFKSVNRRLSFHSGSPTCSPNPCAARRKISVEAPCGSTPVSPFSPECGSTRPSISQYDPFDGCEEDFSRPLIHSDETPTKKHTPSCGSSHPSHPHPHPHPHTHTQAHAHTQAHNHHHHHYHHKCAPKKPLGWFQQLRLRVYKSLFLRSVPAWCSKPVAEFSALLIGAHASSDTTASHPRSPNHTTSPTAHTSANTNGQTLSSTTPTCSTDGTPILEGFFIAAVQLGLCDTKLASLTLTAPGLFESFHRCCEELHSLLWCFLRIVASGPAESPSAHASQKVDPTAFVCAAMSLHHVLVAAILRCDTLPAETRAGLADSLDYAFVHITDTECVRCWLGHAANGSHLKALHASLTQYLQDA